MRAPAGPPDLLTAPSVGGYDMNEIQISPHPQTTAVSIQTTLSHFGSGSLLDAVMGPATTSSLRERWLSPGK
jgi:hypothetical protein